MLDNYEFLLRKREEFANEPIIPPPLVRGDDLIALGFRPGPKFGEISKRSRHDNWRAVANTGGSTGVGETRSMHQVRIVSENSIDIE